MREGGRRRGTLGRVSSRRFHELSAITNRIAELLRPASGKSFWVKAEISSGSERGHFFCDLVESDARGSVVAKMRCQIWASDLARIRASFKTAGLDLVLENGTQVGIACELRWDARYGLSLVGHDMDPAFALGELELRRRRILEALQRDGLFGLNARHAVPLLPNRIGLVTSRSSAAFQDFTKTLREAGHGFRIYVADAAMQGADTARTVIAGLDALARLPLDLIVITRGGGSKTDLAWLDDEAIARRIAGYPLPVWTAIGHEIDTSVLDAVAAAHFKTPTAVAEALVARFETLALHLEDATARLRNAWQRGRDGEHERLARARTGLRQGCRKLLDLRRSELRQVAERVRAEVLQRLGHERSGLATAQVSLRARVRASLRERRLHLGKAAADLGRGSRASLRTARERLLQQRRRLSLRRLVQRIAAERESLAHREQILRAADPATALRRGFSLTLAADGTLVRSVEAVKEGEALTTRLSDGSVESVVRATRREALG